MRKLITATILCLLTALSGAGLLAAAESKDDEKMTVPKVAPAPAVPGRIAPPVGAVSPGAPGTVIIVPSLPDSGGTAVPTPSPTPVTPTPENKELTPHPSETSPPDPAPTVEVPAIPVLPERTPPVEVPALPVLPQPPDRATVLTPPLQQETTPPKEAIEPHSTSEPPAAPEPGTQLSPLDFLPMTPLVPDKRGSKAEKARQPDQVRPEEPKALTPPQAEQTKPEPGDPLRIPPGAAQTGDLAFLEGCWRGTRPEYTSKRIITERFCFDKNGNGKRTIEDPQYAGKCTGAAKGKFDAQGRLIVTSEQGYCTQGARWGQAHMVCAGEGNSTPCFWRFPDAGGGTQNYKIPLVRE